MTHEYKFEVGPNGENNIRGELTFDATGLKEYTLSASSTPVARDTLEHFTELMDLISDIFVQTGGIKTIRIIRKG
jgi:hypothetical protein